jgi:tryptophan synthase beta chain
MEVGDDAALDAFEYWGNGKASCALETAHAVAAAMQVAPTMGQDEILVINCSGRGDKDMQEAMKLLGGDGESS